MLHRRHLALLVAFALAVPLAFVVGTPSIQPASAASATTDNGCFWSFDSADRNLAISFSGEASPRKAAPGDTVTLSNATISAQLQAWLGVYGYNFNILEAGHNDIPASIWVAIEGSNTVEGTQVVRAEVMASTDITPSDPEVPGSQTKATPISVTNLVLPATTWTATGGSIEFRQGKPGSLSESDAGTDLGSLFIAAKLGAFDITFDCRPGTVDIVNPPYPFVPATTWAPFDRVAGPVSTPTTCASAEVTSSWFGSASPSTVVLGRTVEVGNGAVSVEVDDAVLVDAYQAGDIGTGDVSVPVAITGSITASSPAGATQPFTTTGTLTGSVTDGPAEGTGDTTADGAVVDADLPTATFTPGQVGEVTFSPGAELWLSFGEQSWLELDCAVEPVVFESADVVAPATTTTSTPSTTATASSTDWTTAGLQPDLTPKTGTATYPLTCSYVYDLPGSGPGTVYYGLSATGTVPTRVVAGDKVTLSDQAYTVTIPWELRGPLQTGFNVKAIEDGDVLSGVASTTLFASNTVEGMLDVSSIPAQLGPLIKGQASTLTFSPPDQTVTAVGGGPVGFEVRAATFDITISAAQWGNVLVSFDCLATAPAGTYIVSTEVLGVSDLVAAGDPGDNTSAARAMLPATGGRDTRPLTGLGLALVAAGVMLVRLPRALRRPPEHTG